MPTKYRVFMKHEFDHESEPQSAYEIVGTFEASNAKQAISLAAEKLGDAKANGRTFAATPDRGWAEAKTKVETKTQVSLA